MKDLEKTLLKSVDRSLKQMAKYRRLRWMLQRNVGEAPLHVLSLGKAATQMAIAAMNTLPQDRVLSLDILTKHGFYPHDLPQDMRSHIFEAGHPVPDENTEKHSKTIIERISSIPREHELIILLSGGTSSLFEYPREGVSFDEVVALNKTLLRCGLDVDQINKKRREYSRVKGGGAAELFPPAKTQVFLLSDVAGDDPATIGSGPFYLPQIKNHHIVGNNLSLKKILEKRLAKSFPDYSVRLASRYIQEDSEEFAIALGRFAQSAPKGIYLFGGECSLQVMGKGRGGRLSHLALAISPKISGEKEILFCAHTSDGNDNLKESGGAIVNNRSWEKMIEVGNPKAALKDFDSYEILNKIDAIIPGRYTGCNVNDLYILIIK